MADQSRRPPGAHGPGGSRPTPDALIDHLAQHHPEVKALIASHKGPLDDEVARLEADGWTVERVEHVAGKRIRIMKPPDAKGASASQEEDLTDG